MRGSFRTALLAAALLAGPSLATAARLHDAADKGDVEQIKRLVASGASLGERDRFGPPLHHAAARGHPEAVAAILELGADPNALAADGGTALHWAAGRGDRESVALLLAKGADPNLESATYGAPLHRAATDGHAEVVALLLEHGAAVDGRGGIAGANTPLQLAADGGHAEVAKLL